MNGWMDRGPVDQFVFVFVFSSLLLLLFPVSVSLRHNDIIPLNNDSDHD